MPLPQRIAAAAQKLAAKQPPLIGQQFTGSAGSRLGATKNSAYNLYEAAQYTMRSNTQKTYQTIKPEKTVR